MFAPFTPLAASRPSTRFGRQIQFSVWPAKELALKAAPSIMGGERPPNANNRPQPPHPRPHPHPRPCRRGRRRPLERQTGRLESESCGRNNMTFGGAPLSARAGRDRRACGRGRPGCLRRLVARSSPEINGPAGGSAGEISATRANRRPARANIAPPSWDHYCANWRQLGRRLPSESARVASEGRTFVCA